VKVDFTQVSETSGDGVIPEQMQRMSTRHQFARQYCRGKDGLELAGGTGQGLGYPGEEAKTMAGGDSSEPILRLAPRHYRHRIPLLRLDGQALPFKNESFEVIPGFRCFSSLNFNNLLVDLAFHGNYSEDYSVDYGAPRQRTLSLSRCIMVKWQLMPKTMAARNFLSSWCLGGSSPCRQN